MPRNLKTRLMYIEKKSKAGHSGTAWIARVSLSRSGQTVYFNNRALKRGSGCRGNHFDLETRDEYWVSGVKKEGTNRHWAGSGKIQIDARVVEEFLQLRGILSLDTSAYEVTTNLVDTDFNRLYLLENEQFQRDTQG